MKTVDLKAPEHLRTQVDAEANQLFAEMMRMKPTEIEKYLNAHVGAAELRPLLLAILLGMRHNYHAETRRAP